MSEQIKKYLYDEVSLEELLSLENRSSNFEDLRRAELDALLRFTSRLKDEGFVGEDVSLEIALLEQGGVWKPGGLMIFPSPGSMFDQPDSIVDLSFNTSTQSVENVKDRIREFAQDNQDNWSASGLSNEDVLEIVNGNPSPQRLLGLVLHSDFGNIFEPTVFPQNIFDVSREVFGEVIEPLRPFE